MNDPAMKRIPVLLTALMLLALTAQAQVKAPVIQMITHWTGTWATAEQTPVKSYMPYNNEMTGRSVRQVIKVSAGGGRVRLSLSNIFSGQPVVIRSVYIAEALDSFRIRPESARYLTFGTARRGVTIPPGGTVCSDPANFDLRPLERVAITINYLSAPKTPTVHMGSRTTSYILKGVSTPQTDFSPAFRYEKWFNIAALDVYASQVRTVAILGNSITDGKGSTTDHHNRWPDIMSESLNRAFLPQPALPAARASKPRKTYGRQTAVLNLGIGNNRVLTTGYGQPAVERFDRDILAQSGVTDVIIFEGINDIGNTRNAATTARQLIAAYRQMIAKCKARKLRVYLATITPMKGSAYYTPDREQARQTVNRWIRGQKEATGCIDFDKLMRDPDDPRALRPQWRLPDCLHPNAEGYKQMGAYAAEVFK